MVKSVIFGLSLSMLALAATAAHAAPTLRTEGNSCVGADQYNVWGAVNTSGATETVVCSVTTNPGSQPQTLVVHVWDRNSTQPVTCTLYKKDTTGNPVAISSQSTSGSNLNTLPLSWNIPTLQGYGLSLSCTLPVPDGTVTGNVSGLSDIQTTYVP